MISLSILDIAVAPRASESNSLVVYLVVAFIIITAIETIVLRISGWGSFRRSLADALIINLVTTLIGAVGLFVMPELVTVLPAALAVSILIEGLILMLRRKEHTLPKTWLMSIGANVMSYTLVFVTPFLV